MRVFRVTIFHAKLTIALVFHQAFERLHPARPSAAMLLALTLLPVRCSDVIMLRMPRSMCTFESDPWNALSQHETRPYSAAPISNPGT
jgi:hypothetical protein